VLAAYRKTLVAQQITQHASAGEGVVVVQFVDASHELRTPA
jgi:hypothetical protein